MKNSKRAIPVFVTIKPIINPFRACMNIAALLLWAQGKVITIKSEIEGYKWDWVFPIWEHLRDWDGNHCWCSRQRVKSDLLCNLNEKWWRDGKARKREEGRVKELDLETDNGRRQEKTGQVDLRGLRKVIHSWLTCSNTDHWVMFFFSVSYLYPWWVTSLKMFWSLFQLSFSLHPVNCHFPTLFTSFFLLLLLLLCDSFNKTKL